MRGDGGRVEGIFDPLADSVLVAVGAVQVDLMQDAGAVPGPGGDLGGRAAGVQPQRQGGVPQVIAAAGQRRGSQAGAEGGLAGGVPGAAVDRFAEHAAAGAAEQPAVRRGPECMQVPGEHAGQDRRDGNDADGAAGAVLEAPRLERRAGAGPGGAGAGAGGGEDDRAATARREDEVVAAQRDGFFGAQRRVVQTAEEPGRIRATWSRMARTCMGLATVAGLTATAALGARQRTRSAELAGSSPSSTA
jgi:hypothetical protein